MDSNSDQSGHSGYKELAERLFALEQRVAQLESAKNVSKAASKEEEEEEEISFKIQGSRETHYESNFGEYGLAWLGNVVLFFGITFLVEFLRISGFNILSSIFGFTAVAGIFGLAYYFRSSNPYMARIFNLNGYLLIFYVTLKLHFFTDHPLIDNKAVGLILLLTTTGSLMYLSVRKRYTLLTGLSLVMIASTAMVSDSTYLMLSLAALISIIGIVFLYRFGCIRLVFLTIFLSYLVIMLWMFNNPMMGHPLQIVSAHQYGYIYLYLVGAVFSLIAFMPINEESYSSTGIVGAIIFNGLGFVFLMALIVLSFFADSYSLSTGIIALYCIAYAIILKVHSPWRITAALYAIFGFVALTVTIYGIYHFPQAYFYLAIQSLLVVSMAIWFRSKFIVIMNSMMFLILLMIYLSTSVPGNAMNISFSLVALATARILNWKKERLTIRTELIRNFYLLTAFPMVLFTLYHLVPEQYITLSWALASVIYILLSILLKNIKYRYMALGTMIAASLFLFLVDLARIELVYRVIALLSLAIISLGLSFYYTKKLKRKAE
ncbi:MAG TPA: hypothetical protein DCL77_04955 [Prolixibacteraceae bacterium]|jgi:hypothetical protein|nr:hypothetical protein [Prolixibacteraceae bacterium]